MRFNELALELSNLVVVECCVVVDIRGAVDEAVIGDDHDVLRLSVGKHRCEQFTINCGDDEHVNTRSNLVLNLADLSVSLVVGVLEICRVAGVFELSLEAFAIVDPPLKASRRH